MGAHEANRTSFKKGEKAKNWNGFRKGNAPWNKGIKGVWVGEKGVNWKGGLPNCKVCGKQLSQRHSDTKMCRKCFMGSEIGKQHAMSHLPKVKHGNEVWNWKGGRGTLRHRLMGQKKYVLWRSSVFERDLYTCQDCGAKGIYLMAHHIKSWSMYPKLRYKIENGITLCKQCHAKIDKYYERFYERRTLN